MENFEFDDVKKVRKSLLVISIIGILLKQLIKYSTGNIEFLGFKIPIADASFLSNFVGAIIIFYIMALIIRFSSENFPDFYQKKIENFQPLAIKTMQNNIRELNKELNQKNNKILIIISNLLKASTIVLDIIFPILLGIVSLYIIYSG